MVGVGAGGAGGGRTGVLVCTPPCSWWGRSWSGRALCCVVHGVGPAEGVGVLVVPPSVANQGTPIGRFLVSG